MRSKFDSAKRYLPTSLFVNLLGYVTFCLIQFFLTPPAPVISSIISALLMLPISFLINRKWVFRSQDDVGVQFIKFSGTYLGSIASGVLILTAVYAMLPNPYLAQLTSTLLVGGATFIIHSFWTFESRN
jgi:putative flippase GtrA